MDKGVEQQDITRPARVRKAKGAPGDRPRWASGAKTIVGTALSARSRIWYTVSNGTLAEIYFPDVDQANTRLIRFIVTGEGGFFSDEIWDAKHHAQWMGPGAPACRIESECNRGRYHLTKEIVSDPNRDTLLVRGRFQPKDDADLKLYLVIDAHIGDRGAGNNAWIGQYKGNPMVFATRDRLCLACVSLPHMLQASVGFVGRSDGPTALRAGQALPKATVAANGNVAMTVQLDYRSSGDGTFLIAIAGGGDPAEAGQQARAGILQNFDRTCLAFLQQWHLRQTGYKNIPDLSGHPLDMYRVSTAVLETHQSKRFPGGFVASLSLPWGFARSDEDVGGYHVLWPRDMVETALGKLASGDPRSARSTLFYLACTQGQDGGWSQNMWMDGTPHWTAVQMDGIAMPILLADKLHRESELDNYDPSPIVHGATCFLLQHGPVTEQGRWEGIPGYSPYTMATEVAALLAAADFADRDAQPERAEFLRQTADAWSDAIEELTYVEDTPLARKYGVRGYYVRMTPPERIRLRDSANSRIWMPNHKPPRNRRRAIDIIAPGALALVRFGLRAPDDPRILDTVKLIDATLKRQMTTGPGWIRSTDDGYGENADGSPYDGFGIGRCWPLLAGERGMYEIAAGHGDYALELLKTMARQTSECGMIPEQVWDAADVPERFLFNGHPTGSGMPLAWAHAEYIKLLRSLHSGQPWDRVPQTQYRYQHQGIHASFQIWTPKQPRGWLTRGKDLRVDLTIPGRIHWSAGRSHGGLDTIDSGFGVHYAMLPTAKLAAGATIRVTIPAEPRRKSFTVRVRP